MTPKTFLITVVVGAALAGAIPAYAGDSPADQPAAAVRVSPDLADRAPAAAQTEALRTLDVRESRATVVKRDTSGMASVFGPVRDDYFGDFPVSATPAATAASASDIEWRQIGIGFGIGVLLAAGLLLAVRTTRLRLPAH
jgi:hypothetical protein